MRDDRPNDLIKRSLADAHRVTMGGLTLYELIVCAVIGWAIFQTVLHLAPIIFSHIGPVGPVTVLSIVLLFFMHFLLGWVGAYYFVQLMDWVIGRFDYPINSFGEFEAVVREEDIDYPPPCTNCDKGDRDGVLTKTYLKTVRFGLTISAEQQTELYECRRCIEADPIERQFLAAGLDLPDNDDDKTADRERNKLPDWLGLPDE